MKTQAEKRYYRERKKLDKAFNITKDLYYKDCEKLLDKCHKERYEELKASGLYEYEVPSRQSIHTYRDRKSVV